MKDTIRRRLPAAVVWSLAAYLFASRIFGWFNSGAGFLVAGVPSLAFLIYLSVINVRAWRAPSVAPERKAYLERSLLYRSPKIQLQAERSSIVAIATIWIGVIIALVAAEWKSRSGHAVAAALLAAFGICFALAVSTALKGRPRALIPPRLRDAESGDPRLRGDE
jgi:hypothetical protein